MKAMIKAASLLSLLHTGVSGRRLPLRVREEIAMRERFLTSLEYDELMNYYNKNDDFDATKEPLPSLNSILFLVMASVAMADRARAVESWLVDAPNRVYLTDGFLDFIPPDKQWQAPETAQDELILADEFIEKQCDIESGTLSENSTFCSVDGITTETMNDAEDVSEVRKILNKKEIEYAGAQRRQLLYLKSHPKVPPGVNWIILMDDDTWINSNLLLKALRGRDPDEPVMLKKHFTQNLQKLNQNRWIFLFKREIFFH